MTHTLLQPLGVLETSSRLPTHADVVVIGGGIKPDPAAVRKTHARAVELLPALGEASVADAWAGCVDSTPDGVPGIGEVPGTPGFNLAAGLSGHGFGIGPGAGRLIADLVTGAGPIRDPAPYCPERFSASAWGRVADF